MKSWLDIIDEEESNDHDHDNGDHIELPLPRIIDLNESGTLQKEISYKIDDEHPDKIIVTERIFEIVSTKRKISNSAMNRKKNWVKFGQCKNIQKGQIERGVTTQREGNFQFIWNDKKKETIKTQSQTRNNQTLRSQRNAIAEQKENDNDTASTSSSSKYVPPKHISFDKERVDIKISNLPQWTSWNDVKQLIDTLYRTHLKQRYIPKYRIKMFPSNRDIEEWKKYPEDEYCKKKLAEYERGCFVEFKSAEKAKKAIKILNGHRYEYNVLYVEKAKPRNISR